MAPLPVGGLVVFHRTFPVLFFGDSRDMTNDDLVVVSDEYLVYNPNVRLVLSLVKWLVLPLVLLVPTIDRCEKP